MKIMLFVFLVALTLSIPVSGDTVTLKNGSKYQGVVRVNSATEVRIRTDLGTVAFDPVKVLSVETAKSPAKPTTRLATWDIAVASMAQGHWGGPIEQIPATVVDKGSLKYVPYMSHRSGGYEMNIYGDPAAPACIEIGVTGSLINDPKAKANCAAFIKTILGDVDDQKVIDKLKQDQDLIERTGFTFEVTPPTAEDAYGGWWVSVYSTQALDAARATEKEIAAITISRTPAASTKPSTTRPSTSNNDAYVDDWTPADLAKARKPVATPTQVTPSPSSGGLVYVRGYTRKDGTYVSSYTRRAPSK